MLGGIMTLLLSLSGDEVWLEEMHMVARLKGIDL